MKRRYNRNPKYTSIISRVVTAEHPSSHRGFGQRSPRVASQRRSSEFGPCTPSRQPARKPGRGNSCAWGLLIAGIDGYIQYITYNIYIYTDVWCAIYNCTILYKLAKCFTLHISSTGLCQWNPVNLIQSGPAFPMAKILDRVTARHMGGVKRGCSQLLYRRWWYPDKYWWVWQEMTWFDLSWQIWIRKLWKYIRSLPGWVHWLWWNQTWSSKIVRWKGPNHFLFPHI